MSVEFRAAVVPQDMEVVRELFLEYQQWLKLDLWFQGFDEELASLPGKYAEPDGKILLASSDDNVVGGVAMRPLDEKGVCEMKRLFVREKYRGEGIGSKLTSQIIEISRLAGFAKMRLDTERRLEIAINPYRNFGFIEINQYYNNPLEDILYMEIQLT